MRPERLAQLKEWVSESTSADCSMSVVDKFGELFDAIDELAAALENKPDPRIKELEVEVARLKTALTNISVLDYAYSAINLSAYTAVKIARAALTPDADTKGGEEGKS